MVFVLDVQMNYMPKKTVDKPSSDRENWKKIERKFTIFWVPFLRIGFP